MRFSNFISLLAAPTAWAMSLPDSLASSKTIREAESPDLSKLQYIPDSQKPRVFVLTDILNEPDDQQSVVRYLLYSNEFNTRGLCATTSTWLRERAHPDAIRRIVNAYGEVVDNLNKHVHPLNQYTPVERMLSLITSGPDAYGKKAFEQDTSEGALLLIKRLQESVEPLWVLIWGGSNTLAQALKHMKETLPENEFVALRSRIRVYAISDQDDTGEWIRYNYPDIFYICSVHAFSHYAVAAWRGMWEGLSHLSVDKVSMPWIFQYIKMGELGEVYPSRPYGAEGDSPSFLYLIQNGLGDPEHPTYGSWGGRWSYANEGSHHYADALDIFHRTHEQGSGNETNSQVTVARWRDHFQNDMAIRMQWTISSDYSNGTHPPVPIVNGHKGPSALRMPVTPGSSVTLDASSTYDPDHSEDSSKLEFQWYQYRESDYVVRSRLPEEFVLELEGLGHNASTPDVLEANDAGFRGFVTGDQVRVTIPDEEQAFEYHLILQVTSKNYAELPIRRYLRIKLLSSTDNIHPDECCEVMTVPAPKPTNWE